RCLLRLEPAPDRALDRDAIPFHEVTPRRVDVGPARIATRRATDHRPASGRAPKSARLLPLRLHRDDSELRDPKCTGTEREGKGPRPMHCDRKRSSRKTKTMAHKAHQSGRDARRDPRPARPMEQRAMIPPYVTTLLLTTIPAMGGIAILSLIAPV